MVVRAVDNRVVGRARRLAGRPVLTGAELHRQFQAAAVDRDHIDFRARGAGEGDGQQPDGARPPDEDPLSRRGLRGGRGALGVPAGFDERAGPVVDRGREPVQACFRNEHLFGHCPRPSNDPDLMAVRADVTVPRAAATALAAAQHGVPGDPGAVPGVVDPGAYRRDNTAPLMAGTQREPRLSLGNVSQVSGEQLDVGSADADAMDIHDHLPSAWNRCVQFGHGG